MDSQALLTFVTIHRAGGLSAAAERLSRTQPAISRRLALLEGEVGAPLFERIAGGVVLSEAGRALLPHAERVLSAVRDAESAMHALRAEGGGPVSLAAVGTLAGANLTAVLRIFGAEHPNADLSIRTATSAEVSDIVRRGDATIGLRYLLDPASDLVCDLIGTETLRVVCRADYKLAGKAIKSLATLRDETWLAFPSAYVRRETYADNIFAQFQAAGVGDIKWRRVDSLSAQKRLIEAGFGLALLPDSAVLEEVRAGTLATVDVLDLRAGNPVYAVTRKGGYLSPASERLLALLRQLGLAQPRSGVSSSARSRRSKRR
ncbi:MAG TPA: LysR family transcriptional regulator [Stellaceae bacterium]|jgi:DNA-binding transcriptional LysR family regulator|nr:LysR family transcriptional regulator [Stellaceae bacterium]